MRCLDDADDVTDEGKRRDGGGKGEGLRERVVGECDESAVDASEARSDAEGGLSCG